ncbi:hypothetical protein BKA70DRAFT_1122123, partial [Coprinopsis sp. MPI-PUGE-AT-0042]
LKHIHHETRTYSLLSLHPGNSSISFQKPDGNVDAGFIQCIWTHNLIPGKSKTYLLISPHIRLSKQHQKLNPYQQYPGMMADIVYAQTPPANQQVVIQKEDIITHIPFYSRPKGTFSIPKPIMIIVNSLHRGH